MPIHKITKNEEPEVKELISVLENLEIEEDTAQHIAKVFNEVLDEEGMINLIRSIDQLTFSE